MPQERVAVAMSGGVDSSLAAVLLKEAGYQVSGIHMQLWPEYHHEADVERANSELEQTCQLLEIPLHKLNLEAEFQSLVIDYFCQEYSRGRTPNPCIFCNRSIKFGLLMKKARVMGADYLATGHYARVERSPDGHRLLKAVDPAKDQSYFLYTLGQKELQCLLLPLGSLHKVTVRKMARERGLPTADRRESQDICFIPDSDYRLFIARYVSLEPGDIVDTYGRILGQHGGLAQYTIGQRQGLGLTSPERLYVLRLDAASNQLVVGTRDQLFRNRLLVGKLNWVSGRAPRKLTGITTRIRYRSAETVAYLRFNGGVIEVGFEQPQWAITPGQAVVFYRGEVILGGGIIEDGVDCKK